MSKAILIMDMPSRCNVCPLIDESYDYCIPTDRDVSEYAYETKPTWCPLKEVPQQREEKMSSDVGLRDCGFVDGWNACIDKIMGGSGVNG
jgi:hypothetical protein